MSRTLPCVHVLEREADRKKGGERMVRFNLVSVQLSSSSIRGSVSECGFPSLEVSGKFGATFKRCLVWMSLCLFLFLLPGFAQSGNTAAGLAGVGAGAALGAGAANGTTPSGIGGGAIGGGGGSTPIEIQVMAFNGLRVIAGDVAAVTKSVCAPPFDRTSEYGDILRGIEKAARDNDTNQDLATLSADIEYLAKNEVEINGDRQAYQDLQKDLDTADADIKNSPNLNALKKDIRKLAQDADGLKDRVCAVLVEDATSANQIALFQAVQGYYGQLQSLHDQLQNTFPLLVTLPAPQFSANSGSVSAPQDIIVRNVGTIPIPIGNIALVDINSGFNVGNPAACNPLPASKELASNAICRIRVTFEPTASTTTGTIKATLNIAYGERPYILSIQLTGAARQVPGAGGAPGGAPPPSTGGPGPGSTSAGGAAPATAPIGFTYLGDIMTALGAAKGTNTYAPSLFQPTTQAFEALIEIELKKLNIMPYTSTSALNLRQAATALTFEFGEMLAWGTDVTAWANQCKPANVTPGQGSIPQVIVTSSSACNDANVTVNLAVAQQMMNGYSTLLSTANDGNGNPVIVDVLRGKVLSDKMAEGIPSLQVAVVAAGGSSKTNSPFLLGLFYQWAPSYNAGVIATFELRDKNNELVDSGARNVLYGYGKWNPGSFGPSDITKRESCTFCSSK